MTINEKLFNTLQEKNLKQRDLAAYLGITQSVVTNWKNRGNNPPAEFLIQICEFLNITIFELLNAPNNNKSEIENLYTKATPEDKAVIDLILNKYKTKEQTSLASKIG